MRATRSPAVRIPPMPAASAWVTSIPRESPEPTYNPSQRRISTWALAARDAASSPGYPFTGTPQTPCPTLGCTGMRAASMHGLMTVSE